MKKYSILLLSLLIAVFSLLVYPAFSQSYFTIFTNTPPTGNGIDTGLAALIDAATTSVDAAVYSLERQVVVDALFSAHSRGLSVRIVAEDDNYRSDEYGPSFQYLENAGIPVITDTAGGGGGGSMHNKFFVFDGSKVWTGSYNPTNTGTVANSNNAVLICDSSLAGAYADEFDEMFTYYYFGSQKSNNTAHNFTIDGYEVECHFSPSDGVKFQIQSEIEAAQHSVYFMIFSFTDDTIGNALVDKYESGYYVVHGAFDYSQRYLTGGEYLKLRNAGVPVKVDEYPGALHHKLIIFDPGHTDCAVITGSSNWSYSAFNKNDENIVIIRHPDIVNQYYGIFRDIYDNHCEEEGGAAAGAIVISEIMSMGEDEDIEAGDRSNWGESKEEGGSPGEQGEPDTLPPVIVHTPVERVLNNRPIYIHCQIYDPNDPSMYSAKEPRLYYRRKAAGYTFQTTALGALYGDYTGTIPASEVTTDGVEYYLSARDWSYNLATSPSFNPQSHAYQVEVVDSTNGVIWFTEIMYDPPGDVEDETDYEWVEIFNNSYYSTVGLNGWEFTDGEGTYVFPSGAEISPREYQILCKTASGPSGTRYIYGPDSVGDINLNNPLGIVTDQLILKDQTGLIVAEVDYSANWGASNLQGPNNHTLEKIDPDGPDDGTNWMYSMVQGGTPGQESSPHFIYHTYYSEVNGNQARPGIWINPTKISLEEQGSCKIEYFLDRDCNVTLKVYGPPTDPQDYFSNLINVLLNDVPQTADTPYEIAWDGQSSTGGGAYGICRVVLEAACGNQTCRSDADDRIPQVIYRSFDPANFDLRAHEPIKLKYYQSKPEYVTIDIIRNVGGQYQQVRNLLNDAVMYRQADEADVNIAVWDGRNDDGQFVDPMGTYSASLSGRDIFGNVIVVREPLKIEAKAFPRSYFNPSLQSQTIYYVVSDVSQVTMKVRDSDGNVVAMPVDGEFKCADTEYNASWDGSGNTGPGQYSFTIEATAYGRKSYYSGKIALYDY